MDKGVKERVRSGAWTPKLALKDLRARFVQYGDRTFDQVTTVKWLKARMARKGAK